MGTIRAAFFDVDGTLLPLGSKAVSQSTLNAIAQLKEKKILTVVATGRQIDSYNKLPLHNLVFDAYIVANGTMLLDKNKKFIEGTPIGKQETEKLLKILDESETAYALTTLNGRYLNTINPTVIETHKQIQTDPPPVGIYKGESVYMTEAYLPQDRTDLVEKLRTVCTVSRWHESGVDIFSKSAGKAEGIAKFLKLHNLIREQIIAFGDADNDIRMLEFAGTGVAMGNADQSVKEIADFVTDTVDNGGIEKALIHFGII